MSEHTDMIVDATRRIFREQGDPRSRRSGVEHPQLWNALESAGLTRTWIPASLNGSGASLADGFEVLRIAGEFAVDVPLAESLLAAWLLTQADIPVPEGAMTIAPVDVRDRIRISAAGKLSGSARAVPFARGAAQIVLLAIRDRHASAALVDRSQCEIQEHQNLAGEPRDTITLNDLVPRSLGRTTVDFDAVLLMGAAARCMQMAGALQAILDLSVAYAQERVAFEKPIGKFQSIQHSLARLAGEAAAAIAAAGSAADAIASATNFDTAVFLEVASAKIRVGEAVTAGAAIAHQVHGAIGFSKEYVLHRYTHRLWAWRDDFGGEADWAVRLGRLVARNGADTLWPLLATR
jgi:acyl-CoA dehydrogenase